MKQSFRLRIVVAIILVFCIGILNKTYVYAQHNEQDIMSLPGVSTREVVFEGFVSRDILGNFTGRLLGKSEVGVTAISCTLSGNTGGVSGLYTIYIRWTGTNEVQAIKANKLSVTNTSVLNRDTYYSSSFAIEGLSSSSGFRPVGTCFIPDEIEKVKIKTKGLNAYFYNRDFWIKMGEINGILEL